MKKIYSSLLIIILALFYMNVRAGHLGDELLLTAFLDGNQEVPSVSTNAVGIGSFTLNSSRDSLSLLVSVNGLSGPITAAHIHEGVAGVDGPVVTTLTPYIVGNTISVCLTGTDLTPAMVTKYLNGEYYINVHTNANPGGEIRGQITLETDMNFTADLSGANEVPAVMTNGYGLGSFNLEIDQNLMQFNVAIQGLTGPITGVHLHYGNENVNGPITVDLGPYLNGTFVSGEFVPSAALVDSIKAGNVYLNVHTAANPGGELRGQLMLTDGIVFDAMLDGSQEVPAIMGPARGVAVIRLSPSLDSLMYDIVVDSLSGAITGAHFHLGPPGVNGAVQIDLTPDVNGFRITGMANGATLTETVINRFLRGEHYVNVHTAMNPGGEIRGQVYRLAREGFTAIMDGLQEVPQVTTSGMGMAVVSMDRDMDGLIYQVVVSDLSGPITAAHFHHAPAGVSGPVVFDISTSFSKTTAEDQAFGSWNSSSTPAFDQVNANRLLNDSLYVNVHTTLHPSGEIRGQLIRGFSCFQAVTAMEANPFTAGAIKIYPNPATGKVTLSMDGTLKGTEVILTDVMGMKMKQVNLSDTSNEYRLDVSGLPAGVYFVKLMKDDKQIVKKLVVE